MLDLRGTLNMGKGIQIAILVGLLSPLMGCSSAAVPEWPEAVPAKGKVTFDGKPLADATVYFFPIEKTKGTGASGTTNSEGVYELGTVTAKGLPIAGAIPGEYQVAFSRMMKADGTPYSPKSEEPPIMSGATESLPIHLTDMLQTKTKATVKINGGPIDFALKSKK